MMYEHKIKCTNCSLHFTVYSFTQDWKPVVCPECESRLGVDVLYIHWIQPSNKHIFQYVPGSSPLAGIEEVKK